MTRRRAEPSGPRELRLVLTPAYRLDVLSAQGEVFGGGIYRHGSVVSVGLRDAVARRSTLYGCSAASTDCSAGRDSSEGGSTIEMTLTGPGWSGPLAGGSEGARRARDRGGAADAVVPTGAVRLVTDQPVEEAPWLNG